MIWILNWLALGIAIIWICWSWLGWFSSGKMCFSRRITAFGALIAISASLAYLLWFYVFLAIWHRVPSLGIIDWVLVLGSFGLALLGTGLSFTSNGRVRTGALFSGLLATILSMWQFAAKRQSLNILHQTLLAVTVTSAVLLIFHFMRRVVSHFQTKPQ